MESLGTAQTVNVGSKTNNDIQRCDYTSASLDDYIKPDDTNKLVANDETNFSTLPLFEKALEKTDKSDKTDSIAISNTDFMRGVFGEVTGKERPVVVSFPGNPAMVGKGAWFGKPWIADKTLLSVDHNNYTSFATFRPDDEGKYRRQKKQFAALYAVMLDDIGVKVPLDRMTLDPS